nr:hypothetical protein GCM10020093_054750 [Planobispora longispora]
MALRPAQMTAAQRMISDLVDGIHLQAYIKAKLEGEKDEKAREALLKELSSTIAEASRLMLSRYTYVPLLVEIATEHSEHVQKAYEQLIYGTREGWNLPRSSASTSRISCRPRRTVTSRPS